MWCFQYRAQSLDYELVRSQLKANLANACHDFHQLQEAVKSLSRSQLELLDRMEFGRPDFGAALKALTDNNIYYLHFQAADLAKFAQLYSFSDLDPLLKAALNKSRLDSIDLEQVSKLGEKIDLSVVAAVTMLEWSNVPVAFSDAVSIVASFRSLERIEALRSLKNTEGGKVFDSSAILASFGKYGGTLDQAEFLLGFKNTAGGQLFNTGSILLMWQTLKRREDALQIARLQDPHGRSVFGNGKDLCDFVFAKGTSEKAKRLARLQTPQGRRAFDGYDISVLNEAHVSDDQAKAWAERGIDAVAGVMRQRIGIANQEFLANGKPKCLLALPGSDHVQFIGRSFLDAEPGFFASLPLHYDVKAETSFSRGHLIEQINKDGPNLELLVLADHGQPQEMKVGRDRSVYGIPTPPEELVLKKDDLDFFRALKRLPAGCRIVLNSCSTASGPSSFAEAVTRAAPQCTVFASEIELSSRQLVICSVLPLDIRIIRETADGVLDHTFRGSGGTGFISRENLSSAIKSWHACYSLHKGHHFCLLSNRDVNKPFQAALHRLYGECLKTAKLRRAMDVLAGCSGVSMVERRDPHGDNNQAAALRLAETIRASVTQQRDPNSDGHAWQYLFGERWRETWCPAYGIIFPGPASRILMDHPKRLAELGFRPTRSPSNGDLVVYYEGLLNHPDSFKPVHCGEYQAGKVISKYNRAHVMLHPLNCAPAWTISGDNARYAIVFYHRT